VAKCGSSGKNERLAVAEPINPNNDLGADRSENFA
jgi:hypothetical protein